MSFASWERKNFLALHLPSRIWTSIQLRIQRLRFARLKRRRTSTTPQLKRDCGECPLNGSTYCPCKTNP